MKELFMAISRVQKFKEYRNSLIKEETPHLETPKSSSKTKDDNRPTDTTSTLPMEDVIQQLNNEEVVDSYAKKQKILRIVRLVAIIAGVCIVVAGIIVFGILVWRN